MLFVTLFHLTDHRIKPSTITRVSVDRDADSAFTAAANEKESTDKHKLTFKGFDTLIWCIHKNTIVHNCYNPSEYSHYYSLIFSFASSPLALNPALFHTGKRGLVTPHQ